ncbi:MAG TPA: helix-turn-helix domain-containing protein [Leptospiraceae bacterium]|nr:helix-turn-helix domain-containing protein [Leptospiraceae bacterium]HNN81389.1 helix-turn-helix domain-containing protein [Leptospiraceae bacterium]
MGNYTMNEKKIKISDESCPVTYCMKKIGGKWKPVVLYLIRKGANRFGILQRGIEGISKQMLTTQLRELEEDGILERIVYAEIPPRVEYRITKYGKSLFPIIDSMSKWGNKYRNYMVE